MTLTIDDAHDLLTVVAERHQDPTMTGHTRNDRGLGRRDGRAWVPEHNALVLLNELMDDISEFRDRTGANPN